MSDNLCKGCRTHMSKERYYPNTSLECVKSIGDECPCRLCIIKSMCITECEPYNKVKILGFHSKKLGVNLIWQLI